jgi:hypothetical protein
MRFPDESYPRRTRAIRHDPGPVMWGGLQDRVIVPASGPERKAGLPPCGTRCQGRKCGKMVVHRYADGWHCISCGVTREDVPDA